MANTFAAKDYFMEMIRKKPWVSGMLIIWAFALLVLWLVWVCFCFDINVQDWVHCDLATNTPGKFLLLLFFPLWVGWKSTKNVWISRRGLDVVVWLLTKWSLPDLGKSMALTWIGCGLCVQRFLIRYLHKDCYIGMSCVFWQFVMACSPIKFGPTSTKVGTDFSPQTDLLFMSISSMTLWSSNPNWSRIRLAFFLLIKFSCHAFFGEGCCLFVCFFIW